MKCYDKSYALLGFTVQSVVVLDDTIGSVDNIAERYCVKISKANTFEPRLSVRLSSLLVSVAIEMNNHVHLCHVLN